MGKKKGSKAASSDDFLQTLEDFTSKENWDKFFTLRGNDDSFEWYAEWPQLRDSLLPLLQDSSSSSSSSSSPSGSFQILVPGCGNSRLSEHLYDAGFRDITNVDFSKVVISDMLRRNIRTRPELRWRVMDITKMQVFVPFETFVLCFIFCSSSFSLLFLSFTQASITCLAQVADDSFDMVLDKGALDALMEPEVGTKLGNQYLSEVRVCSSTDFHYILMIVGSKYQTMMLKICLNSDSN